MKKKTIFWFRNDLRIHDNPGFYEAARDSVLLPIFILEDKSAGSYKPGTASRWWLYESLKALNKKLAKKLNIFVGSAEEILPMLSKKYKAEVFWNRRYEPWGIKVDKALNKKLEKSQSFNGSLLWEPCEILKLDSTPYKVFTSYYTKGCLRKKRPSLPLPTISNLEIAPKIPSSINFETLSLMLKDPSFNKLENYWEVGEVGAQKTLSLFLKNKLNNYKIGRNFPEKNAISRLSPHLHFGEISPQQVWNGAIQCRGKSNVDCFLKELAWREFSYYLLYHYPTIPTQNFNKRYDLFPWNKNSHNLRLWQEGKTGYPFVDAGMRELSQTGFMHNRLRMIVGSFLIKNLLIDWRCGESWFWNHLVDADLASNSASWQWVAGCGADAAPYFRIFNPTLQGKKFDPQGIYTRKYIPELSGVPDKHLFEPWATPLEILAKSGIKLGTTYPKPIVSLNESRKEAIKAFHRLKH